MTTMTADSDLMLIGLDPSLRGTGVAWARFGDPVKSKRFGFKTVQPSLALACLKTQVGELIASWGPLPKRVLAVIEGYSVSKNYSTGMTPTIEAGGVLKSLFAGWCPVVSMPATMWKSIILGRENVRARKATKAEQAAYLGIIAKRTGVSFSTTDEADAYCLIAAAWELLEGRAKTDSQAIMAEELKAVLDGRHASL